MTTLKDAAEEVGEALAPLDTWRYAASAERTMDLNAVCQDAMLTLAWWGWGVTVSRPKGEWSIQASRTIGGRAIRARGTGGDYYDAALQLRNRLLAVLAGAESEGDDAEDDEALAA